MCDLKQNAATKLHIRHSPSISQSELARFLPHSNMNHSTKCFFIFPTLEFSDQLMLHAPFFEFEIDGEEFRPKLLAKRRNLILEKFVTAQLIHCMIIPPQNCLNFQGLDTISYLKHFKVY